MTEGNYKGLPNIGATCYINSFLQTLFMTPQFRDGIYQWTYNEKVHPKKQDSILFQLQKLFAKLELKCQDISTRELVKSFQWQDQQAFDQQDIQEFNRVLFEALQKSFMGNKKTSGSELIKELYEGQLAHYTKCFECHNQSSRQQIFQDLILIIKNIYEKVYNHCIELSLQRYIKPEILDQNNLYQCDNCKKKVSAQRGVKFIKLPKLLNVVLQRFHFDFYTETRNKLNDKFTFPHVLNFNHYFNGYEQIPNKMSEDSSEYFLKDQVPKKKTVVRTKPPVLSSKKVIPKTGTTTTKPAVVGKVNFKASVNTKAIVNELRKKRLRQIDANNQDLIYVSGTASMRENQIEEVKVKQEEPQKIQANELNKQKSQELKKEQSQASTTNSINGKDEPIKQAKIFYKPDPNFIPPPPPPSVLQSLGTPTLSEPYNISDIPPSNKDKHILPEEQLEKAMKDKQALIAERQNNLLEQQKKNREQIDVYLKDGPLVYELYSILVHVGTSNAGHYTSYIKSFEDGKWYSFNDERVNEVNVVEVQKSFGGSGLSNAYVLYYRLVDENRYKMESKIPQYIKKVIQEEEQTYKMRQISKLVDLQNTLVIKIYFQLGVKSIEIMKQSTLALLFQKCKEMFNIKTFTEGNQNTKITDKGTFIREDNIRIRLFSPANDTKLDTYRGKQDETLENLNIKSYQNFILETKAASEEFDDYVFGYMSIRIALWEQNLNILSLQDQNIELHKVSVNKVGNMLEMQQVIKKKRSQFLRKDKEVDQGICVVKRHQNDEYLYHQIINLPDYYSKTIDEVGIFESEILFVELDSDTLNWPREFQNEINRISVKFHNSSNGENSTITTDSRITLNELKQKLCEVIKQPIEETIIKRGNKSGIQVKNGTASLKDNRFINGTTLFLERGLPAKMGEIRIQLFMAEDASPTLFNRLHEFEFIADVPVDTSMKASEVKVLFREVMMRLRRVDLDCSKMRIREKVSDKLGKIYRQRAMKQQQMIQKRQIAIEMKQDNLQLKDYSIYVRTWDQQNWLLSPRYEFIVSKSTTMKDLASEIYQHLIDNNESNIIMPEEMDICRILSIHKFSIIDLVDMEYFGMNSEVSALGEPMYVNSDGLLYVIKQTGIEPRGLTREEQAVFGGKIKAHVRPTRGRTYVPNSSQPQKKEKGITIKVVENKEEEKEETKNESEVKKE